jgi:hypothetical protein
MAQNMRNTRNPIVTPQRSHGRSILRLLGRGGLGATGDAAGLGRAETKAFRPLWNSAQVTPTRTMRWLNLAAVMFAVALGAGWDRLKPPATAQRTATARATPLPVSEAVAPPEQATSVRVRTKTIRVGDSADDISKTLEPADSRKTDVGLDPTHPGSLLVTHHYEIEGQSFSLTFARSHDPGPYRLVSITTFSPEATF